MKFPKKLISLIALSVLPLLAVYHLQRPWDTSLTSPPLQDSSSEITSPQDVTTSSRIAPKEILGDRDFVPTDEVSPNSKQLWREMIKNVAPIDNPKIGPLAQPEGSPLSENNHSAEHSQTSLLPDFFKPQKEKPARPKISGKLLTNHDDEIVGAKVSVSLPTQH